MCPACLDDSLEPLESEIGTLSYRRCRVCGLVQMDSGCRLDEAREEARYLQHENHREDAGYIAWLMRFLDFALAGTGSMRILDFGSGPEPVMASLMEEMGHEVHIEDKFFAQEKPEGRFDLITSVEVFEHLESPLDTLRELAGRLAPEGRICISTELMPEDNAGFRNWHYRSDPTHITFFTRRSLECMADHAGLILKRCDGKRYADFTLDARFDQ